VLHAGGYSTFYAHLSTAAVEAGARVARGDRVGASGRTGAVTGPHLHYELNWGGASSDSLSLPTDALLGAYERALDAAEQALLSSNHF
jgi:murein DD-endopeptidase MepM/ murein hydrolase activator NlpD